MNTSRQHSQSAHEEQSENEDNFRITISASAIALCDVLHHHGCPAADASVRMWSPSKARTASWVMFMLLQLPRQPGRLGTTATTAAAAIMMLQRLSNLDTGIVSRIILQQPQHYSWVPVEAQLPVTCDQLLLNLCPSS